MSPSELQHGAAQRSAHNYASLGPRIDKVRQVIAGFKDRKKILDVGCANGSVLAPFVQQHELHGVDISENFLAMARAVGFQAVVHDIETKPLPYADGTFDIIFSGETIEHQVDTDWMLSELNRVLKPGGTLVLTFPNIRTVLSLGMMLLDMPPMYAARYRAPHFRDFTVRTMKTALQNHGFKLEQAIGCSFYLPKIGEYGSGLATYFPSWSNQVIAVSTKTRASVYSADEAIGEIY